MLNIHISRYVALHRSLGLKFSEQERMLRLYAAYAGSKKVLRYDLGAGGAPVEISGVGTPVAVMGSAAGAGRLPSVYVLDAAGRRLLAIDDADAPSDGRDPARYVMGLAWFKAQQASLDARARLGDAGPRWIVAADTMCVRDGEVIGKPADAPHAERMLRAFRGRARRRHHRQRREDEHARHGASLATRTP